MFYYAFLSKLPRDGGLFADCMAKLSTRDERWPREQILLALDSGKHDCFVCAKTDSSAMVGAMAFNAGADDGIVRVFLIYVVKEFQRQGIGTKMVADFIALAVKSGFKGAQIGFGNSQSCVKTLQCVKNAQSELLCQLASAVEIVPATGVISFKGNSGRP